MPVKEKYSKYSFFLFEKSEKGSEKEMLQEEYKNSVTKRVERVKKSGDNYSLLADCFCEWFPYYDRSTIQK